MDNQISLKKKKKGKYIKDRNKRKGGSPLGGKKKTKTRVKDVCV